MILLHIKYDRYQYQYLSLSTLFICLLLFSNSIFSSSSTEFDSILIKENEYEHKHQYQDQLSFNKEKDEIENINTYINSNMNMNTTLTLSHSSCSSSSLINDADTVYEMDNNKKNYSCTFDKDEDEDKNEVDYHQLFVRMSNYLKTIGIDVYLDDQQYTLSFTTYSDIYERFLQKISETILALKGKSSSFLQDQPSSLLQKYLIEEIPVLVNKFCMEHQLQGNNLETCIFLLSERMEENLFALEDNLSFFSSFSNDSSFSHSFTNERGGRDERMKNEFNGKPRMITKEEYQNFHQGQGVLYFVHPKKCGGMTIQTHLQDSAITTVGGKGKEDEKETVKIERIIMNVIEEQRWWFFHSPNTQHRWTTSYNEGISSIKERITSEQSLQFILADHFPYGYHSLLPSTYSSLYMTILRNPRARLQSYFEYLKIASDWEYDCKIEEEEEEEKEKEKEEKGEKGEEKGEEKEEKDTPNQIRDKIEGSKKGKKVRMGKCKNNWWPRGMEKNVPIRSWLESQLKERHYTRAHVDNYMTRLICGEKGMKFKQPVHEEIFICAKNNLQNNFHIVGLTERMDETICLAESMLLKPMERNKTSYISTCPYLENSNDKDGKTSLRPSISINYNQYRSQEERKQALIASKSPQSLHYIPDFYIYWDEQLYDIAIKLFDTLLNQYPCCSQNIPAGQSL